MVDQSGPVSPEDGADDDEGDTGSHGAGHEQDPTAYFVDPEQGWKGAETVDDAVDASGKEGSLSDRK